MNQNRLLRLVIEDQIKGMPQEQQEKVNALTAHILDIASQSDEGAIALALASAKFAEANE